MSAIKVLFLCVHNSARSQMAEAFLKQLGGDKFAPESAGLEPGTLNPLAIQVMQEEGIDISQNPTKDVFAMALKGKTFDYVITVCDANNSERCPFFPGIPTKIAWQFDDPSSLEGSVNEKLDSTRIIRDKIKVAVKQFIEDSKSRN